MKIPANGGSRPWVKGVKFVDWIDYQEAKQRVPDIDEEPEPDAYHCKNHWEERIEI